MRKFRVTVNGQPYDVLVEEFGAPATATPTFVPTARPPAPIQPASVPKSPPPAPLAAPPMAVKPSPAPQSKPVQPAGGSTVISAPMPGVILNVLVSSGQSVKIGDVLLILEAMKMENEVTASTAGVVKEVAVSKGSNVNTGDLMVVIE
ncbi:MAG: biotin/lipoyl-binding protein [Dethiobacter sp.]|nr:biotin/lipoyl-binding protein [Dethiobacter sp.]